MSAKQETTLFLPVANSISRRGMLIQYYAHAKIPETIWLAVEGLYPDFS